MTDQNGNNVNPTEDSALVEGWKLPSDSIMPPIAVGKSTMFIDIALKHAQRVSESCHLLRTKVNADGIIVLDPKPVAPDVDYVDPEGNTHVHIHLIPEPIGDTLPGWYYSDECQILNGPYGTLDEAEAELDSYVKHLGEECGYNFNKAPEQTTKNNEPGSWDPTGEQSKCRVGGEPKLETIFTHSHGEVLSLQATIQKLERDLEATKVQLVTAELVARNLLDERDAKPKILVAGVHYEGEPATLEDFQLFLEQQQSNDNTVLHHPV